MMAVVLRVAVYLWLAVIASGELDMSQLTPQEQVTPSAPFCV